MKRVPSIILCLILFFLLAVPCTAHPGSLDSNGGHYNHSTGEYHYHDGTHTSGSSSSSSSSSGSSSNYVPNYPPSTSSKPSANSSSSSSSDDIDEKLSAAIVVCAIFFGGILVIYLITFAVERSKSSSSTTSTPNNAPSSKSNITSPHPTPTERIYPPTPPIYTSKPIPFPQPPRQTTQNPHQSSKPSTPTPARPQTSHQNTSPSVPTQPKSPTPTAFTINKPATATYIPVAKQQPPNPKHADSTSAFDMSFFTSSTRALYEQSLKTDRAKRALAEDLSFENLKQDTTSIPIKVSSLIRSESGRQYQTTLTYCSCPDSQIRHVVCKHMIALALKVKAITLDAPLVETSADREMITLTENANDSVDNDLPF